MAKGARASTKKANHQKLKSNVFGPVETARTERLSAKLLALASQPKPGKEDVAMVGESGGLQWPCPNGNISKIVLINRLAVTEETIPAPTKETEGRNSSQIHLDSKLNLYADMEVDGDAAKPTTRSKSGAGRIEKRRSSSRKAAIVFPKFKNGKKIGKTGKSKSKK